MGNETVTEKKSIVPKLIIIASIILVLGGISAAFYFNVGGINDNYLKPVLAKVGLFNDIVSEDEKDEFTDLTKEDLITQIKELRGTNTTNLDKIKTLEGTITVKDKEIKRLSEFEKDFQQYKIDKEAFDKEIANNDKAPSADEYTKYYKMINAENAEKIYKEIVTSKENQKKVKEYTATYQQMDANKASLILNKLSVTDMDLVVLILSNVDSEQRASIMGNLDPKIAARITKTMAPK